MRLPNPLSAVVWLALLTPGTPFGGLPERLLGLGVCVLGCVVLWTKPSPWETRGPARRAAAVFGALQLLAVASYAYSLAFNGLQTGLLDCLELPRYLCLGVFTVTLIRHDDGQVGRAVESALAAAAYGALVILLAGLKPELSWAAGVESPVFLGYVSTLAAAHMLFFSRSRLRGVHAAAALLAVLAAGGRPSGPAVALLVAAAAASALHQELMRRRVWYAPQLSAAVFILLLTGGVACFHQGLALRLAPDVVSALRRSPVLGWGPARYESISALRNQYLSWFLEGGALSAGLILAGLGMVSIRLLRSAGESPARRVGAAAFLASVALMLWSGRFFESFRLFFLTAFVAAGVRAKRAGEP
jgi:hypothetical protein